MKFMVSNGFGLSRDWLSLGAPSTHKMFDLSPIMYVHNVRVHVNFRIVISWEMEF